MIWMTLYLAPNGPVVGVSVPTGSSCIAMARPLASGELVEVAERLEVYDNGDGTRLCLSDFPFKLEEDKTDG